MNNNNKNDESIQCECSRWGTYEEIGVGHGIFPTFDTFDDKFETIRERNPWLVLARCKHFRQGWYAYLDTGDYDDIFFIRITESQIQDVLLNDKWPDAVRIASENDPSLGEEIGPELCRSAGCERKRVQHSLLCRLHHYENLLGNLWKP
jgi:hypothetical protein